jgi:hypothetical protein
MEEEVGYRVFCQKEDSLTQLHYMLFTCARIDFICGLIFSGQSIRSFFLTKCTQVESVGQWAGYPEWVTASLIYGSGHLHLRLFHPFVLWSWSLLKRLLFGGLGCVHPSYAEARCKFFCLYGLDVTFKLIYKSSLCRYNQKSLHPPSA